MPKNKTLTISRRCDIIVQAQEAKNLWNKNMELGFLYLFFAGENRYEILQ